MLVPPSLQIFTDGAARGNPGPAAAACLIYDDQRQLLKQAGKYLGVATNNEAEYQGVLLALNLLSSLTLSPRTPVTFYSDSELLVNQLSGRYKIKKPHLAKLASQIFLILKSLIINPEFKAIPRAQNREADALANRILDQYSHSHLSV